MGLPTKRAKGLCKAVRVDFGKTLYDLTRITTICYTLCVPCRIAKRSELCIQAEELACTVLDR